MNADIYNWENEKVGTLELPAAFSSRWSPVLVQQVLLAQLANRREPWSHVKGRGEVRGGGKKPWRQKGTGRARHGSIRSPLWIGGGKAHAPTKERDYTQKINKKMRRAAILSILSRRVRDGELKIFDDLSIAEPKTKVLYGKLKTASAVKNLRKPDVLLVPAGENKNIFRAASNIPKTKAVGPAELNVYDLLNYKSVWLDKGAVEVIAKHYSTRK